MGSAQAPSYDACGGCQAHQKTPDEDEEEAIMPAIDIGMEMPEVEIPRVPTEDQRPIPRRLYIRVKDIERHGATELQGLHCDIAWSRRSASH